MKRDAILNKALETVTQRQQVHGKPENTFGAIAGMWSVYLSELIGQEIELKDHQAAIMVGLLKVARSIKSPEHADNYVDLAGYAACAGELAGESALQQIVSMGQEIENLVAEKVGPIIHISDELKKSLAENTQYLIAGHMKNTTEDWPVEQHGLPTNLVQEQECVNWEYVEVIYRYVAKDKSGAVWAFTHKPVMNSEYDWWVFTERDSIERGARAFRLPQIIKIPGDWRDSLRKRPKNG